MSITITSKPTTLLPGYNPIVYKFFSNNTALPGFRYLVDIYNTDTNSLINSLSIVPQPNSTGYVDISKILSNELEYTFNPLISYTHSAATSSLNYYVNIGEEYRATWEFTSITKNTTVAFTGLTNLNNFGVPHTYVAGDYINITTIPIPLVGLHKVMDVHLSGITVDVTWFGVNPIEFLPFTGITSYADNRKTQFPGLSAATGTTVFNGAYEWFAWRNEVYDDLIIDYGGSNFNKEFLSDFRPLSESLAQEDRIYMTRLQSFWLNIFTSSGTASTTWYTNWKLYDQYGTQKDGATIDWSISGPFGKLKQFKIGFNFLGLPDSALAEGDYIDFKLSGGNGNLLSTTYRIYYDARCQREDVELYWLDSKGSILSQAFPNKEVYTIDVEKETYKTAQLYGIPGSLDTTIPAEKTRYVDYKQTFELKTNWITEGQAKLLAGMVASPYVWYKNGNNFDYQPVLVKEKGYEVTYQRNKKLIQKTITVTWSNQTPINI